eukprot:458110-Pelagomonas_calceolata.AAC.3
MTEYALSKCFMFQAEGYPERAALGGMCVGILVSSPCPTGPFYSANARLSTTISISCAISTLYVSFSQHSQQLSHRKA